MYQTDAKQQQFRAALDDAEQCGFVQHVQQIGERAYAAKVGTHGWAAVASELAERLPGQLIPFPRDGMGWKNGGRGMTATVIDSAKLPDVEEARYCVKSVMGQPPDGLAWTMGGNARLLLKWAAESQKHRPSGGAEKLLLNDDGTERELQHHDCTPGVYDHLQMWDCSSYYWNLMSRLPSLRLTVTRRGLLWHPLTADETERWADVLAATTEHRVLRNSLWGISLGTWGRAYAYTKDKETGRAKLIRPAFGAGPFRSAALLVARSGSELCQAQSIALGSVYSTVDSVTVAMKPGSPPGTAEPALWHSLGFPAGLKHEGVGEVCRRGSWKIGGKQTKPYGKGQRQAVPVPAGDVPARQWYREWL